VKKEKIDETGLYSFATREQERGEKIVIGGMTLTKRGERLLIISFTLLLLTAMVVVGTIE
jgi:hypothetical protein